MILGSVGAEETSLYRVLLLLLILVSSCSGVCINYVFSLIDLFTFSPHFFPFLFVCDYLTSEFYGFVFDYES